MTLPPPNRRLDCTWLGLEIGVIYGAGSLGGMGWTALLIFPLLGMLTGFICDQRPAH